MNRYSGSSTGEAGLWWADPGPDPRIPEWRNYAAALALVGSLVEIRHAGKDLRPEMVLQQFTQATGMTSGGQLDRLLDAVYVSCPPEALYDLAEWIEGQRELDRIRLEDQASLVVAA